MLPFSSFSWMPNFLLQRAAVMLTRTITTTTEASMLVFGKSMTLTGAGMVLHYILGPYIPFCLFAQSDVTDACYTQQRRLGPL